MKSFNTRALEASLNDDIESYLQYSPMDVPNLGEFLSEGGERELLVDETTPSRHNLHTPWGMLHVSRDSTKVGELITLARDHDLCDRNGLHHYLLKLVAPKDELETEVVMWKPTSDFNFSDLSSGKYINLRDFLVHRGYSMNNVIRTADPLNQVANAVIAAYHRLPSNTRSN